MTLRSTIVATILVLAGAGHLAAEPAGRRPIPQWMFGPRGEPNPPTPPRAIPFVDRDRGPRAKPRPNAPATTGTIAPPPSALRPQPPRAPGAVDVPVTPLE